MGDIYIASPCSLLVGGFRASNFLCNISPDNALKPWCPDWCKGRSSSHGLPYFCFRLPRIVTSCHTIVNGCLIIIVGCHTVATEYHRYTSSHDVLPTYRVVTSHGIHTPHHRNKQDAQYIIGPLEAFLPSTPGAVGCFSALEAGLMILMAVY